jgi:predicted NBD/HSP70 family sugar kinase
MAESRDPRPSPAAGAGAVLRLIREGDAVTRADLARATGLARSTVAQRVDALLAHSLVYETGSSGSTGGRPPTILAFNDRGGVILAADLGATHSRVGVTDLAGQVLAERAADIEIALGPEEILAWLNDRFAELLEETGRSAGDVRGIGIGVPGPVSFSEAKAVNPPIMPGWDGFSIRDWFAQHYDAPVLVDNDVNIMALGEHWTSWRETEHLLFIKVGTGIGCGIVASGSIHRGAQGAAGDIGHVRVSGHDDIVCRCGNLGCLEAVAGGGALATRLTAAGVPAENTRDVVRLVRSGDPEATRMVRDAGRSLGEVLASCVNFFNPRVIVIGGDLGGAHEQLLAGVREVTFLRSLPLATGSLRIVPSQLDDRAGVIGAAVLVVEHVLAPDVIDRAVERGTGTPAASG